MAKEPTPIHGGTTASSGDEAESYERRLNELDTALAEVERALRRLDEGTYGTCEVCGRATELETEDVATAGLRCSEHHSGPLKP